MSRIVDFPQGSDEWKKHRAAHYNASEAAAMLGISSYMSRNELLHQKATGIIPEVDAQTQKRFDSGHENEATARPWAEEIINEGLFPVVIAAEEGEFDGLPLGASLDGLTMLDEMAFEHKTLNKKLEEALGRNEIPAEYHPQMEQQLLLSGADRCLFMASKGDRESMLYAWYESDPAVREQVISGWKQFRDDLANYKAPEPEQPKEEGKAPDALPALSVQVRGMVTASNLREFEESARATLAKINTDLQTDSDFANAEKTVKFCKEVEKRLDATKENVLGQMQTVDEVVRSIDSIREETRQIRLKLDRAVKDQKEKRKMEILNAARSAYAKFYEPLERAVEDESGGLAITLKDDNGPDFAGAMSGKKNISSLQSACDDTLASAKIELNQIAEIIRVNIRQLNEHAGEYKYLFRDFGRICQKPAEDFSAIVKSRIAEHKEAEEKRLAAEREQIRQQEEAKAQREARARANQEDLAEKYRQAESEQQARYEAQKEALAKQEAKQPEKAAQPAQKPQKFWQAIDAWQQQHGVSGAAVDDLALILERFGQSAAA